MNPAIDRDPPIQLPHPRLPARPANHVARLEGSAGVIEFIVGHDS